MMDLKIRLVAECFAVLNDEQVREMADSMDLPLNEVYAQLRANEIEWETIKDKTVYG